MLTASCFLGSTASKCPFPVSTSPPTAESYPTHEIGKSIHPLSEAQITGHDPCRKVCTEIALPWRQRPTTKVSPLPISPKAFGRDELFNMGYHTHSNMNRMRPGFFIRSNFLSLTTPPTFSIILSGSSLADLDACRSPPYHRLAAQLQRQSTTNTRSVPNPHRSQTFCHDGSHIVAYNCSGSAGALLPLDHVEPPQPSDHPNLRHRPLR